MILITYKTHSAGGFFIGTLFIAIPFKYILINYSILQILILLILYIYSLDIGSLFPDIDHPQSYLGKRYSLISNLIHKKFSHRGFTHSLLFIYLLIFLSLVFNLSIRLFYHSFYAYFKIYIFSIQIGFILGCISHIFFDMFNPTGVYLLYPHMKKYRLPLAPKIIINTPDEKQLCEYLSILSSILSFVYFYVVIKSFSFL
ncbi:metal-dependent hydrolase [Romboutsia sp. CE17]|uniref:metal-dependent hydrolase n=1 Tax=Romboutsia sp. CE17 TaxID=2724150 RepID=UPI003FA6CD56